MKQHRVVKGAILRAALILGLSSAGVVCAEGVQPTDGYGLIDSAFPSASAQDVQVLSESTMAETEGELWPFSAAVVTIDLGLATFFWGSYVPTMAAAGGGSGVCPSCSGRNHIPR